MVSLISFLDENARRRPDHLACMVGDDSLSCGLSAQPRPGIVAQGTEAGFCHTSTAWPGARTATM
jgi:hypothetical protein